MSGPCMCGDSCCPRCNYDEATFNEAIESIETNLWLAAGYEAQSAPGLARECVQSAYADFLRFDDDIRDIGPEGIALANRVETFRKRYAP